MCFLNLNFGQNNLPNIDLKTLSNSTISTQKIAEENELIIISLWATWCVPCKNELDEMFDLFNISYSSLSSFVKITW